MTYRRLFLWLFIGSTLLLAGVWWSSLRTTRSISTPTYNPLCTLQAQLFHGNIGLFRENIPHAGWLYDFHSSSFRPNTTFDDTQPLLFGILRWYDATQDSPFGPSRSIGILFRVWVPWLLFVGGAFAFCRVMERRSRGRKEKDLVERQAAEKLGRETD